MVQQVHERARESERARIYVSSRSFRIHSIVCVCVCARLEWFDVLCQAHSGEIVNQINVKMTSADRSFIKGVLAGIHNQQQPESWVREQFRTHTCRFLEAVMMQKRPKEFSAKLVAEYTDSPTLVAYVLAILSSLVVVVMARSSCR